MSEINGMCTPDAQAMDDFGVDPAGIGVSVDLAPCRRDAGRLSGRAEELPQDGMHLHHLLPAIASYN